METSFQNVGNLCEPKRILWYINLLFFFLFTLRFAFLEKFLPQSTHGKTSTGPLCFSFLWPNKDLLDVKSFPQSWHTNLSMLPWTSLQITKFKTPLNISHPYRMNTHELRSGRLTYYVAQSGKIPHRSCRACRLPHLYCHLCCWVYAFYPSWLNWVVVHESGAEDYKGLTWLKFFC